jgi:hypothetical protein
LAGYVPRLQSDGLLVRFLNERAGGTIPSPAILSKIGRAYVEEINAFAKAREIPVVRFAKDMVKEDVFWRERFAAGGPEALTEVQGRARSFRPAHQTAPRRTAATVKAKEFDFGGAS